MREVELRSVKDVLTYLIKEGFKASQSSLYRHISEKKLDRHSSGVFKISAVRNYAKRHLTLVQVARKEEEEDLYRVKKQKDISLLEEKIKALKVKISRLRESYIVRKEIPLEIISRTAVFDHFLSNMLRDKAPEWVKKFIGNPQEIEEFVGGLKLDLVKALREYCNQEGWRVGD